jgi:hypothetical protein
MREQIGPRMLVQRLWHNWPALAERLPDLPVAVTRIIDQLEHQAALYPVGGNQGLTRLTTQIKTNHSRATATLSAIALAGLATALILIPPAATATIPLLAPVAASLLLLTSLIILWRNLIAPSKPD